MHKHKNRNNGDSCDGILLDLRLVVAHHNFICFLFTFSLILYFYRLEEFKALMPPVDLIKGAEMEMTIRGETLLFKNATGGIGTIHSRAFTEAVCVVFSEETRRILAVLELTPSSFSF